MAGWNPHAKFSSVFRINESRSFVKGKFRINISELQKISSVIFSQLRRSYPVLSLLVSIRCRKNCETDIYIKYQTDTQFNSLQLIPGIIKSENMRPSIFKLILNNLPAFLLDFSVILPPIIKNSKIKRQ
jgi:hypothetical protein